jgi:spore coat protein A
VQPISLKISRPRFVVVDGGPPLPHEAGWKDTAAVDRDEDVRVIARFDGYRGRYLLHCHNLE